MTNRPNRTFELVRCETIPEVLSEDKLYYSEKYHTATHLCPCGCGSRVVTPIAYEGQSPERSSWFMSITSDNLVDMRPSVGNFNLPCKSHYYIRSGRVEWCC